MKRGGYLRRRQPLRSINPERRDRLHAAQFGVQAEWCRTAPCSVPSCNVIGCDPHHVPSRGAGGLDADTVPLCRFHHSASSVAFHQLGEASFNELHGTNLREIARALSEGFR